MVVELIKKMLLFVVDKILLVIELPDMPEIMSLALDTFLDACKSGISIINVFCPMYSLRTPIDLFFAVWSVRIGYMFLMWVLKKIPMLGIE